MISLLTNLFGSKNGQSEAGQIEAAIENFAGKYDLDPSVIAAVVQQESGGNPWAFRYEDGFYRTYIASVNYFTLPGYKPKLVSQSSECRARATSFGLMQVMGETAREHGYSAEFLTKLCSINDGLDIGCKILRDLINRFTNSQMPEKERYNIALLKYNGGGDPSYADKVMSRISPGHFYNGPN